MKNIQWYGWKKDKPDSRDLMRAVRIPRLLPERVYLQPGMPHLYDQGDLGSCTANAIAAAIEFDRKKQGLNTWTPSRLFIYYNERAMEGTISQDSGAEIRDGIKSVNVTGVTPEDPTPDALKAAIWPYDIKKFAQRPPKACYTEAKDNLSLKYQRVVNSAAALQAVLAEGYPIVFGFNVYESFESDVVAKTGIMPMPKPGEQIIGGHAVILIGYSTVTRRFSVRNSWGYDWGQHGNFLMPFDFVTSRDCSDFWTIELVS